jgi:hypothetical protein
MHERERDGGAFDGSAEWLSAAIRRGGIAFSAVSPRIRAAIVTKQNGLLVWRLAGGGLAVLSASGIVTLESNVGTSWPP